jgi:hypothetical protein
MLLIRFVRWETKGVRGMPAREERIAKTESLFRSVNERIAEASERFDAGDNDDGEFMCECADPSCAERLEVPLDEYEEVREDATTFVLDPDHVRPEIERIVRHGRGYAVVKKVDAVAARIVRKLDPRSDSV